MSAALPCESLDDLPRLSKKDNRIYKCTLCSDRVAVGQEPACVKTCPTGAIVFGTKEKMIEHAGDRILLLQVKDGRITWPTDAAALRKTPDWAKPILEAALSQAR